MVDASQESHLGTIENSEYTKDNYLCYKNMNDYCLKRLKKMSLLILQLIN